MTDFSLQNPVFATYVIAACLMILKVVAMSWLTVVRMMQEKAGFRSPEDAKKSPTNPAPREGQVGPNERVDRIRRIQLNDLENIPFFLVAGLLYVTTGPDLVLAQWLFYGFAAARLAHTLAYSTAQSHEVRAVFYTIGSLIVIAMGVWVLAAAIPYALG